MTSMSAPASWSRASAPRELEQRLLCQIVAFIASEPLQQGHANPDVSGALVVVDHAFTVAIEHLHMATQQVVEREAIVQLHRAMCTVTAAQRMASGQCQFVAVSVVDQGGVATADVIVDVRVVV